MPRNLLVAVFVAACIALLLSFIPELSWKDKDIAAFQPVTKIILDEQNLVDLFTLLPTHYNIKRVKWENHSLYVDFSVIPEQKVDQTLLYQDFYSLVYRSFQLTRNVEHLYYRLLEEKSDTHSATLLMAIQADRPQGVYHFPEPQKIENVAQLVEGVFQVRMEPGLVEKLSP